LFEILQMFQGICFTSYRIQCFPLILVCQIQSYSHFYAKFTAKLDEQMKTVIYIVYLVVLHFPKWSKQPKIYLVFSSYLTLNLNYFSWH